MHHMVDSATLLNDASSRVFGLEYDDRNLIRRPTTPNPDRCGAVPRPT